MTETMIAGERIFLRPIQISDATAEYGGWINDPQVVRFTESRFRKVTVAEVRAYVAAEIKKDGTSFFAIVDQDTKKHVGNIKVHRVDQRHQSAEISLLIGDKSFWGKGVGSEAIRLMTEFAFTKLGLHKLIANCYANNLGSIKAFQKAGFEIEGRMREQYFSGDSYVDGIILGRLNG